MQCFCIYPNYVNFVIRSKNVSSRQELHIFFINIAHNSNVCAGETRSHIFYIHLIFSLCGPVAR